MFDESHVEAAEEVEDVAYATVLRGGKRFRVVYKHKARTALTFAVENVVGLQVGSGRLASTQEHKPSAQYRPEDLKNA